MLEVNIQDADIEALAPLVGPDRYRSLHAEAARLLDRIDGRRVWNVNSTASGGGVAEMLAVVLAYVLGMGVPGGWLVIDGSPEFWDLTKRLHNRLHGVAGDDGELGPAEHEIYREISRRNAEGVLQHVRPGELVILHDPQTAGLIQPLVERGASVIWRCHIGRDDQDEFTAAAWSFLRPYLEGAHSYVFTRRSYVPEFLDPERVTVIAPAIDPFATKNREMQPALARSVLAATGLLAAAPEVEPLYPSADGGQRLVTSRASVLCEGPLPGPDDPLVVQVSRWDHLKDMAGVMRGFVDHVEHPRARLVLAGPDVAGVTDDPEGQQVLNECTRAWHELPEAARRRVCLTSLPMKDSAENAWIVNALQRHAYLVAQKSLVEGFGLTVAEAMWKGRPVVASAVGGLQDQVIDGVTGRLIQDPADLAAFGAAVQELLDFPGEAERQGRAGYERCRTEFLPDRHLLQWGELLQRLLT